MGGLSRVCLKNLPPADVTVLSMTASRVLCDELFLSLCAVDSNISRFLLVALSMTRNSSMWYVLIPFMCDKSFIWVSRRYAMSAPAAENAAFMSSHIPKPSSEDVPNWSHRMPDAYPYENWISGLHVTTRPPSAHSLLASSEPSDIADDGIIHSLGDTLSSSSRTFPTLSEHPVCVATNSPVDTSQ